MSEQLGFMPQIHMGLDRLSKFVDPQDYVPMSEAVNMYRDLATAHDGRLLTLQKQKQYALDEVKLEADLPPLPARPSFFHVVEGTEQEGAAYVVGTINNEAMRKGRGPLIRMHSSCAFSEVGIEDAMRLDRQSGLLKPRSKFRHTIFMETGVGIVASYPEVLTRSRDCDCREQRKLSQRYIAAVGGLYIGLGANRQLVDPDKIQNPHEGRGIGLKAKYDSYGVEAKYGVNTAEAFRMQGLKEDNRYYGHVARFLAHNLGLSRVQLLSNNPRKIAALEAEGIEVFPRELLSVTPGNVDYVRAKARELGHTIDEEAFVRASRGIAHIALMPITTPPQFEIESMFNVDPTHDITVEDQARIRPGQAVIEYYRS